MHASLTKAKKSEIVDKDISDIILFLMDKVIREVMREKTATEMWVNLESLYMAKSVVSFSDSYIESWRLMQHLDRK